MTLISKTHNQGDNFREEKNGRKLVRVITAESTYRCNLLFLDHILYRRAHFIHNALCASPAVLAIKNICKSIIKNKNNQQNMFMTLIETRFLSLRDAC